MGLHLSRDVAARTFSRPRPAIRHRIRSIYDFKLPLLPTISFHNTLPAAFLPSISSRFSSQYRTFTTSQTLKMRLPYVDPSSPSFESGSPAEIIQRVRDRRSPRPLQALDLTLLHSPNVADGWNSYLGAIRTKTSLQDDVREIAICRVAVINEAWYEWGHHAPLAKAGGVSDKGIEVLGKKELGDGAAEVLGDKQLAVVRYTDAMTRDVKVPDEVFAELRKHFNDQEVVEITATVAAYNCVSRFLVALDVGEKNSVKGPESLGSTH